MKMTAMMKGIDISKWQGDIDFAKAAKDGIDFVIIRAGCGRVKDPFFAQNYSRAKAAKLKVGAYWYSYAESVADARSEAAVCASVIRGKQFEFPIFFDLEERSQFAKGKEFCSDLVKTFCGELENVGYFAGLYISRSPLQTFISEEVAKRYALWVAEYSDRCRYGGSYGMWQYSCKGKVNGISGDVDLDECYIDYPSIIVSGGFNGFGSKEHETSPEKTITELALECIRGDWGNGDERRKRLASEGYDPQKVQCEVNRLLERMK